MNKLPVHDQITNDLYSIRPLYLEDLSKFFRQSIVHSEMTFNELKTLRSIHCQNYKGSVQIKPVYSQPLTDLTCCIELQKYDLSDSQKDYDERFRVFTEQLWVKLYDVKDNDGHGHRKRSVIFVSSYYEYLRLQVYFKKTECKDVVCVSEYTTKGKLQRALTKWNRGDIAFLLLTERAYYFNMYFVICLLLTYLYNINRCPLKRAFHLYFYSLPKNTYIYKELILDL